MPVVAWEFFIFFGVCQRESKNVIFIDSKLATWNVEHILQSRDYCLDVKTVSAVLLWQNCNILQWDKYLNENDKKKSLSQFLALFVAALKVKSFSCYLICRCCFTVPYWILRKIKIA